MRRKRYLAGDLAGLLVVSVVFIIPFAFIILNSLKDTREANLLKFSLPERFILKITWRYLPPMTGCF